MSLIGRCGQSARAALATVAATRTRNKETARRAKIGMAFS